jgi:hypothetical protein
MFVARAVLTFSKITVSKLLVHFRISHTRTCNNLFEIKILSLDFDNAGRAYTVVGRHTVAGSIRIILLRPINTV